MAYSSAEEMFDRERLDFVDIVTRVETHLPLVRLTVQKRIPIICQKPIAPDCATALLTHEGAVHGWIDGHRFRNPDPAGPVMGDTSSEGERGTISIPSTGDVYRNNVLAWKNDVTVGYRGDSVRGTQAHFISCLKDGSAFESGGREYLRTFAAVEAAYRSVSERRSISLAEMIAGEI